MPAKELAHFFMLTDLNFNRCMGYCIYWALTMKSEEEHILNTLEWRGKGLIKSAYDIATGMEHLRNCHVGPDIL
jgi:hypothetical protein